ncbi:uncharacterized protein BP5553_06657 [Venustampulla echinocandica]|uniref:Rhodopsin domain-containing protein n=1 Tax=Venustampulla echinocandica TaxID=2656787 RepID=A0A370TKK2_9HELO|nr:uncharacterized protein BP5553_06657 [Venustampulla echinocandica]RDL36045.1 hypothetical protein BP5553_06657 [Venustampulla echinocandica]
MPLHDKLIVTLVLSMGTVAVIASALRIFFMHPGILRNSSIKWYEKADGSLAADMTWNAVNPGEWTLIEANLMIICASIFALRRLWAHHREKRTSRPAGSVSGRRAPQSASRRKLEFYSLSHILQRTSDSNGAGDSEAAEQSGAGTGSDKELIG